MPNRSARCWKLLGHGETAQQQDDEHVVDAERLLYQIPRVVLESDLLPVPHQDDDAERQRSVM
jgi:hypothetical protein